jgi:hypothetical protein
VAKSFLSRVSPSRARTRVMDWPFPVEGDEQPKIRICVLGADKLEQANLEAHDHFAKAKKGKVDEKSEAFVARERTALIWHAVQAKNDAGDWEPLADSVDELAKEAPEVIMALYYEWHAFQAEVAVRPMSSAQFETLVEELKKNTRELPLSELPTSWLIKLCRGLASQLASSTPDSGHG